MAIIALDLLSFTEKNNMSAGTILFNVSIPSKVTPRLLYFFCVASRVPSVTISPSTGTVNEGGYVTFYCSATGDPEPTKVWSRVDGVLPSGTREENGYLVISGIKYEDAGVYRCTATNSHGVDFGDATLFVNQGKPNV